MENRYVYTEEDVVGDLRNHPIPTILSRTYIEQKEIRDLLTDLPISSSCACDFGAGFGRLTPVLQEFATRVFAFEREEHFRDIIELLNPTIEARSIEWLADTKMYGNMFDIILCWTVIQHMHDDEMMTALSEIKRIASHGSYLILCEETKDTGAQPYTKASHICKGRPIRKYEELLAPEFNLISVKPRPKESTNYRDVGTIMIFQKG